jgi:hypothetical protein
MTALIKKVRSSLEGTNTYMLIDEVLHVILFVCVGAIMCLSIAQM